MRRDDLVALGHKLDALDEQIDAHAWLIAGHDPADLPRDLREELTRLHDARARVAHRIEVVQSGRTRCRAACCGLCDSFVDNERESA